MVVADGGAYCIAEVHVAIVVSGLILVGLISTARAITRVIVIVIVHVVMLY